jgi:multiple sugar transport system ATP-binding protein
MNLVDARVADGAVVFAGHRIALANGVASTGAVVLGIRPQDLQPAHRAPSGLPTMEVIPSLVEELGSTKHVIFPVDAPPVDVESTRDVLADGDSAVLLATDRRALFSAEVGADEPVRAGEPCRLALDPSQFHYFDVASGERVAV